MPVDGLGAAAFPEKQEVRCAESGAADDNPPAGQPRTVTFNPTREIGHPGTPRLGRIDGDPLGLQLERHSLATGIVVAVHLYNRRSCREARQADHAVKVTRGREPSKETVSAPAAPVRLLGNAWAPSGSRRLGPRFRRQVFPSRTWVSIRCGFRFCVPSSRCSA